MKCGLPLMSKRRTHSPESKFFFAMKAISECKTIQEIAADHDIHATQESLWNSNSWMLPVSCLREAGTVRGRRRARSM